MSFYIIKQPPFDSFTFRNFFNCTYQYRDTLDCFYTWSYTLEDYKLGDQKFYTNFISNHIQNKNVIIGIKDHLTKHHFNPWFDTKPLHVYYFENLFQKFSNTKFLLFTSLENLTYYLQAPNLVGIIPWGGDLTNQHCSYKKLEPVFDKNFNSTTNFISLNRGNRHHRTVLISLLHYFKINRNGIITCLYQEQLPETIQDINWRLNDQIKNLIDVGLKLAKLNKSSNYLTNFQEDVNIYKNYIENDNVANFENVLRNRYRNSFVEIISETSMTEQCFNLTEKTLNSIYGCNFPIFNSSTGTVQFLRDSGLDVFDDIIDHSYDLIENPAERIFKAVNDNLELLSSSKIKNIWNQNKPRFSKNVDFVKNDLYKFYENRTHSTFNRYIHRLL